MDPDLMQSKSFHQSLSLLTCEVGIVAPGSQSYGGSAVA